MKTTLQEVKLSRRQTHRKMTAHEDKLEDVDLEELKPVLGKLEEALEKLSISLKKHFGPLRCDSCDFEARNQNGLTMHKRAKHTAQ